MPVIPKKIHFVWVGGPIKAEYVPTLIKVSELAQRSGFEMNLWVDNESNLAKSKFFKASSLPLSKDEEKAQTSAAEVPRAAVLTELENVRIPHLRIRNINQLKPNMKKDAFYQEKDRFENFWNFYHREMIGFKNFAAAADLLRYEILRQEGGYYFDTDTKFYLESDSKLVPLDAKHGFLLHAQGVHTSRQDFIDLNNDIIAALPDNELLKEIIAHSLSKLVELDQLIDFANAQRAYKTLQKIINKDSKQLRDLETKLSEKKNPTSAEIKAKADIEHWQAFKAKLEQKHFTGTDIRRWPQIQNRNAFQNMSDVADRLSLTVDTTGPGVVGEIALAFCKKNRLNDDASKLLLMFPLGYKQGMVHLSDNASCLASGGHATSWFNQKKASFDDFNLTSQYKKETPGEKKQANAKQDKDGKKDVKTAGPKQPQSVSSTRLLSVAMSRVENQVEVELKKLQAELMALGNNNNPYAKEAEQNFKELFDKIKKDEKEYNIAKEKKLSFIKHVRGDIQFAKKMILKEAKQKQTEEIKKQLDVINQKYNAQFEKVAGAEIKLEIDPLLYHLDQVHPKILLDRLSFQAKSIVSGSIFSDKLRTPEEVKKEIDEYECSFRLTIEQYQILKNQLVLLDKIILADAKKHSGINQMAVLVKDEKIFPIQRLHQYISIAIKTTKDATFSSLDPKIQSLYVAIAELSNCSLGQINNRLGQIINPNHHLTPEPPSSPKL